MAIRGSTWLYIAIASDAHSWALNLMQLRFNNPTLGTYHFARRWPKGSELWERGSSVGSSIFGCSPRISSCDYVLPQEVFGIKCRRLLGSFPYFGTRRWYFHWKKRRVRLQTEFLLPIICFERILKQMMNTRGAKRCLLSTLRPWPSLSGCFGEIGQDFQ